MYDRSRFPMETGAAFFQIDVKNILLWSDETPHLYTLVFTLKNEAGEAVDFECQNIGFRTVVIGEDGVLRVNKKRLIVRELTVMNIMRSMEERFRKRGWRRKSVC